MVVKRSSEAMAVPAPAKEEDFPRGGGGALTVLERRQAREEGRSRAEHELKEGSRTVKKRKSSNSFEVLILSCPVSMRASGWCTKRVKGASDQALSCLMHC